MAQEATVETPANEWVRLLIHRKIRVRSNGSGVAEQRVTERQPLLAAAKEIDGLPPPEPMVGGVAAGHVATDAVLVMRRVVADGRPPHGRLALKAAEARPDVEEPEQEIDDERKDPDERHHDAPKRAEHTRHADGEIIVPVSRRLLPRMALHMGSGRRLDRHQRADLTAA